jgi:hypothetical protein
MGSAGERQVYDRASYPQVVRTLYPLVSGPARVETFHRTLGPPKA